MNTTQAQVRNILRRLARLRIWLFLVLVAALYGFIVWRIQTLAVVEPDAAAIAAQAKTTSKPNIDPALVEKVQQLEESNVTVKALFDQARQNPFRE